MPLLLSSGDESAAWQSQRAGRDPAPLSEDRSEERSEDGFSSELAELQQQRHQVFAAVFLQPHIKYEDFIHTFLCLFKKYCMH